MRNVRSLLQGRIGVRGVKLGCRYLKAEAAQQILADKKVGQDGSHTVNPFSGIHWKLGDPDKAFYPGVEKAVLELIKLAFHQGSPPTMLLNFVIDENRRLPVLASQTIQGISLKKVMEEHPEWLDHIDTYNFSMMTFLGFLVDPYDGKPDNFMVTLFKDPLGNLEKLVIASIDNDYSLSSVFLRNRFKDVILDIFYALFSLKQMHLPLDPTFRDEFLRLYPEEVVIEWLKSMMQQNELYQQLREKKVFSEGDYHKLQLPFTLRPHSMDEEGFIDGLYRKICTLQAAMSNPSITHWDLFQLVHPLAARVYERRLLQYDQKTPEQDRRPYERYMSIHAQPNIKDLFLPDDALAQLGTLDPQAFACYQQSKNNDDRGASRTLLPERALERFIASLTWNRYAPDLQYKWLHSIATMSQLEDLCFQRLDLIDNAFLTRTLRGFPRLNSLTLFGCPKVTGSGLFGLLNEKPHLKLTLGDCSQLQADDFDVLGKHQLTIRFASGVHCDVKKENNDFLYQAIREKDEEMIFFALRFGIAADAIALRILAQLEHPDTEQLKRWLTVLFLSKAIPDNAALEALRTKPTLNEHLKVLSSNPWSVIFQAQRQQAPWLTRVPSWANYFEKK